MVGYSHRQDNCEAVLGAESILLGIANGYDPLAERSLAVFGDQ